MKAKTYEFAEAEVVVERATIGRNTYKVTVLPKEWEEMQDYYVESEEESREDIARGVYRDWIKENI